MSITNQAKPTTSLTNATRVNIGETWTTNPYTWALETRKWEELVSLITNSDRDSSSLTNVNKPT